MTAPIAEQQRGESQVPRYYRPELDVVRFTAFLLVFMHHVLPRDANAYSAYPSPIPRFLSSISNACGFGLPLFFFLSAFLITDLLRIEKQSTGNISIKQFYARRLLRIWPLYALGLLIGVTWALISGNPRDALMFGWYAVLVGNWYFAANSWSGNPMTPLWSISIEEQFYLFWPAVMKYAKASGVLIASALMFAVAVAAQLVLGAHHRPVDTTIWSNTFVQLEFFGAGSALAMVLNGRSPQIANAGRLTALSLGWIPCLAAAYWFDAKGVADARSALTVVFGYSLVTAGLVSCFLAVLGWKLAFPRPLLYLGKISYGLYVFHLIPLTLVMREGPLPERLLRGAAALAMTISMAAVSFRWFETPFLHMKERFSRVASHPV